MGVQARSRRRGNRRAGALIATIILIVLIAVLVYVIAAYLGRDTALRRIRLRGEAEPPLSAGDFRVRRAFEVLSGSAVGPGNRIDLLENGHELFPRLLADVRAAQRLITWQVYWFKPGELATQLAEALAARARAGVEVLVLLDYFGAKGLGRQYVDDLRANGVSVQMYRAPRWKDLYKVPHRSHVRSVVLDGRIGYTGGFGIDDRWLGEGREPGQWRDTHVRVEGPAVDQLQAPFIANWAECTGELLLGDAVMQGKASDEGDAQQAGILYCSPSLGSTTAERFLALTISAARRSLYITNAYFVPSEGFRQLLCTAASAGVDVRVLTPGSNTDEPLAWYAGRAHYEELLRAGVRLWEYEPTMLHAKTIVADEVWVSIGSVNFDNRSLKLNDEVALVAQDLALGRDLHEMFVRDLAFAREVTAEQFGGRSKSARVKERAALLVAALL